MKRQRQPTERLVELFSEKPCWTISQLCEALGYAGISIKRFLKQIGYYSSFTHNSKWYTLHSVPKFNPDGIWFYEDIGFCKHGNLKQTIVHLIDQSPKGMSARELAEKLSVADYAVLNHMYNAGVIDRVKARKGFVYLSGDASKKQRQLSRLQPLMEAEKKCESLNPQAAVYVLAEFIKHPQASFAQISRAVAQKQVIATPEMIARLFEEHGIKKTLP